MDQVIKALSDWFEQVIESSVRKVIKEEYPNALREARAPITMDTQEVMRELNIKSRSKLKQLRDSGVLSYVKNGTHITYPRESVIKYVSEHTIKGKF